MLPFTYSNYTLRLAQNNDSEAVSQLIDSVYREYGDTLNIDGADADLLDFKANYFDKGGEFVVLVSRERKVVASHAVLPLENGLGNFKRLYLVPELRGGDWGNILMNWAIISARALKIREVEFWSDSRFHRAHKYFERFGFKHDGRTREMDDGSMPYSEKYFSVVIADANLVEPLGPGVE